MWGGLIGPGACRKGPSGPEVTHPAPNFWRTSALLEDSRKVGPNSLPIDAQFVHVTTRISPLIGAQRIPRFWTSCLNE